MLRDNLQRRFESFVKLPEKGFFLGIADYVQYIEVTPNFEPILLSIKRLREQDEQKLNDLEMKLKKDIDEVAPVILNLIDKNKVKSEIVDKAISEYKGVVEGRIQSTATEIESLHEHLEAIIRALYGNGYKNLVTKYTKSNPDNPSAPEYKISEYYYPYIEELRYFRSLMKTAIWGSWNELVIAYLVTHQYKQEMEAMGEQKDFWRQMSFHALHKEMQQILGNERDDSKRIHFIYDDYLIHINRVHNYFIEQLSSLASYPSSSIQKEDLENKPDQSTNERKLTKKDLRKKINQIIKSRKFGKKEKGFLQFLANDFEPQTIERISSEVSTKDCKHLKGRVEKKIKGTGFIIKTIKATGWGNKSQYQLKYLPNSAD